MGRITVNEGVHVPSEGVPLIKDVTSRSPMTRIHSHERLFLFPFSFFLLPSSYFLLPVNICLSPSSLALFSHHMLMKYSERRNHVVSTAFKPENHEVREQTSPMEQAEASCTKMGMMWGSACQTKRADVVSPQAHSCHLGTDPKRARKKPRLASHMAGPRVHSEWLLSNVHVSNILRTTKARREEPPHQP